MRYAIGRILWIVPTLITASLLLFYFLAPRAAAEGHDRLRRVHELPLFLNEAPADARSLSAEAMRHVADDDAQASASAVELARLGGAALPHILPELDALDPDRRARVARALVPVAQRMRLGGTEELANAESAAVFWRRFWEDQAIDYRPSVARRVVRRIAEHDSPGRREDILKLDTFALAELVAALGPVRGRSDVLRVARLTDLLAHITGLDWRVRDNDDVAGAAATVGRWNRWWALWGGDYVTYSGPQRAVAMVLETQYGKWATQVFDGSFGTTASGVSVRQVALATAPITLWLVGCGLLGGYPVGILIALWSGARPEGWRDLLASSVAIVLLALPIPVLGSALRPLGAPTAWGGLLMVVLVAAVVSRYQRSGVRAAQGEPSTLALRAWGSTPLAVAHATWRASTYPTVSLAAVDLPAIVTMAFVIERVLGLSGLSEPTLAAVEQRDVHWLVALALMMLILVGLGQLASDACLGLLDPRVRAVLSPRREVGE